MFRWPSIAIAASALCASVHAAPPSGYKMTILSVDDASSALAINNSGDVVVGSIDGIYNGTPRTYLYSSGVLTNIGSLGGGSTTGLAINDAGEIAGMAQDSTGASRAFFYSNGTMNAITSGTEAVALSLNNSGAVVGYLSGASPEPQAFLYQNGTTTMLGSLGLESHALQINDSGTAVGLAFVDPFTVHAVTYANGQVTDISNGYASVARAINNSGTIAGYVYQDGGSSNSVIPFIYKNGQMDLLGQMYNGGTYVNDINDSGAIVGTEHGGFLTHGFLYDDGSYFDLNNMLIGNDGWLITDAFGINNGGQIVGDAVREGKSVGVLLTPYYGPVPKVPEPAGWAMMVLGFGLVGSGMRGQNRPDGAVA